MTLVSKTSFVAAFLIGLSFGQAPATAQEKRIVAAGGVITEIVYALGRQADLVGVDTTSQYPAQALREKPDIGYVRALGAEGILSLKPSKILAIEGAGPPDTMKLLAETGIPLVTIKDDYSETGVSERIRMVGAEIGEAVAAARLSEATQKQFAELARQRQDIAQPKRILFVLSLQNGRPLVGGAHTSADAIIALAGGVNAASVIDGYKPMTDEAIVTAAPDIVLMMDRGGQPTSADDIFKFPAFLATPAASTKALISMDGLYLLGFGPRTPQAARDLMHAVYSKSDPKP